MRGLVGGRDIIRVDPYPAAGCSRFDRPANGGIFEPRKFKRAFGINDDAGTDGTIAERREYRLHRKAGARTHYGIGIEVAINAVDAYRAVVDKRAVFQCSLRTTDAICQLLCSVTAEGPFMRRGRHLRLRDFKLQITRGATRDNKHLAARSSGHGKFIQAIVIQITNIRHARSRLIAAW